MSEAILAVVNMDKDEIAQVMCREFAVKLFREKKFSLEQAADFCKMNIYDFLAVLSGAGVSAIDYDPEELEQEIAGFQTNEASTEGSPLDNRL
jgi:predicted HTH domain antitoxin